jgi:hypothetical protein
MNDAFTSEDARDLGIPNLWRLVDRLTIRTGCETELNRAVDLARSELATLLAEHTRAILRATMKGFGQVRTVNNPKAGTIAGMPKRGYSREFTPKTDRRVRLEIDRIPPTLFYAVKAKAKREGVSL